jgi:hypothetical protein
MLLSMAREEDFTVFIPFDADEFYVPEDETCTLRDVIEAWVSSDNGEQMIVPMPNFLVPRDTEFFRARTLGRMPYRIAVKPGVSKQQLNLRLLSQYKSISRISGIPNAQETFVIGGNHRTLRLGAQLQKFIPSVADASPVKICHVPFPSRNMTANPSMAHRARRAAATPSGEQPHPKSAQALRNETWRNASLTQNQLDGQDLDRPFFALVPDESCLHILNRIIDAGFDVDDPWCRSLDEQNSPHTFVTRHFSDSLLFDAGVSAVHAQVGHVSALYKLLDAHTVAADGATPQSGHAGASGGSVPRSRSPMKILYAQAQKKDLQQTIVRLQRELEEAKSALASNQLMRVLRAILHRLKRRPRNVN